MLRSLVPFAALAALVVGCGGSVVAVDEGDAAIGDGGFLDGSHDGDVGADAGDGGDAAVLDGSVDGGADSATDAALDAARDATDIRDAMPDAPLPDVFQLPDAPPVLVDAGCRDAGTPPPRITCDAYAQTGCAQGQGCYPYTIPPQGVCGVETYGTTCRASGSGTQGESCSRNGCSAGYICIVGSGGENCARLCNLTLSGQCPRGLTCQPVDVSGYGVCA
jgi:hypothetical protein